MRLLEWYADWWVIMLTRATVRIVDMRLALGDSPLDEKRPRTRRKT